MAKKQNLDPSDDNFGQDVEEAIAASPKAGGINKTAYLKGVKEKETLNAKKDDAISPLRTFYKQFEEKGGNTRAEKFVEFLAKQEDLKGQDIWRSICQYLEWRGFFDQGDMVSGIPADPSTKKAVKAPAVPVTHFGSASASH